jgi:hypothetical protein
MDCHEITPDVATRAAPIPPDGACCGLVITMLLHGFGAHPASRAVLSAARRRLPLTEPCASCALLHGHDTP